MSIKFRHKIVRLFAKNRSKFGFASVHLAGGISNLGTLFFTAQTLESFIGFASELTNHSLKPDLYFKIRL